MSPRTCGEELPTRPYWLGWFENFQGVAELADARNTVNTKRDEVFDCRFESCLPDLLRGC